MPVDIETPVSIGQTRLVPATCLACKGSVWHWPKGTSVGQGPGILFDCDVAHIDRSADHQADELEIRLSLHPCNYELAICELDDADPEITFDFGFIDWFNGPT